MIIMLSLSLHASPHASSRSSQLNRTEYVQDRPANRSHEVTEDI